MVTVLQETEYIRDDTKDLIAFAEMGEYPCKYCESGERGGCVNACRAWPIWFSIRWQRLQEIFKR